MMDKLEQFGQRINTTYNSDVKLIIKGNSITIDNYKKQDDDKPSKIQVNFIKEGSFDLLNVVKSRSK